MAFKYISVTSSVTVRRDRRDILALMYQCPSSATLDRWTARSLEPARLWDDCHFDHRRQKIMNVVCVHHDTLPARSSLNFGRRISQLYDSDIVRSVDSPVSSYQVSLSVLTAPTIRRPASGQELTLATFIFSITSGCQTQTKCQQQDLFPSICRAERLMKRRCPSITRRQCKTSDTMPERHAQAQRTTPATVQKEDNSWDILSDIF
jgi:hypothetical protein